MRTILLILMIVVYGNLHAQLIPPAQIPGKDSVPPYLKYPKLPAFNIMELDSSTIFNTYNIPGGSPIAIVYFDPNCKHCRHSTARLMEGMDSVSNVQFYFVTPVHDLAAAREFYKTYRLGDYKNIKVVGRDYEFFFLSYYAVRSFPDVAIYDKHKKLVKLIDGEFNATRIYEYVH